MNLIEKTPARQAAEEIQRMLEEIKGINITALRRVYELVSTPGQQQAIVDEFGANGAAAFQAYVSMQTAMEMLAPGQVPPGNPEVFVPQEDGTLLYVAPPAPETPYIPEE